MPRKGSGANGPDEQDVIEYCYAMEKTYDIVLTFTHYRYSDRMKWMGWRVELVAVDSTSRRYVAQWIDLWPKPNAAKEFWALEYGMLARADGDLARMRGLTAMGSE